MGQAGTRGHGLLGGHIGGLVLQGRRVLQDGCLLRAASTEPSGIFVVLAAELLKIWICTPLASDGPISIRLPLMRSTLVTGSKAMETFLSLVQPAPERTRSNSWKVELVPTAVKWVGATIPRSTLVTLPAPGAWPLISHATSVMLPEKLTIPSTAWAAGTSAREGCPTQRGAQELHV